MGDLSWILAFTMNVFITLTLLAAAASACPELLPAKCGPEAMMCPGGMDPQSGCPLPDLCVPGIWARQDSCPSFCPTFCGPDEMMCPGGMDDQGCPMPDMCMPSKGAMEHCPVLPNSMCCCNRYDLLRRYDCRWLHAPRHLSD